MTETVKEVKETVQEKTVSPQENQNKKPEMKLDDPWDNWSPSDEIASNWFDV